MPLANSIPFCDSSKTAFNCLPELVFYIICELKTIKGLVRTHFSSYRNGRYSTSPLVTRICSRNQTVPEVLSHSNQLYLKFTTDSSVTYRGFKIYWDSATTGDDRFFFFFFSVS